jgi:nucleoside-diphosphate-sugar epimerase
MALFDECLHAVKLIAATMRHSSHLSLLFVLFLALKVSCFTVSPNAATLFCSRKPAIPPFSKVYRRASRRSSSSSSLVTSLRAAAITSGDTVLVVGGTGGVGQLVTKKLVGLGEYNVRVTSRDVVRGKETIGDDAVDIVSLDLVDEHNSKALEDALSEVSAVVISVGTTAFPTGKWKGGNTPRAIDELAVDRIAKAAAKEPGMKKIVLLTSVGVDRTKEFPFLILNLFGVLDAKKSGEQSVIDAAKDGGFDYAIVRPGRLVGGPYTNPDVAKLLQIEGGAENGVTVEIGDSLLGDCKRDACAESVVRCLTMDECRNVSFSIVSNEEKALSTEDWSREFTRMAS